eukprot:1168887-Alexandrium_andersonii.AAC.1
MHMTPANAALNCLIASPMRSSSCRIAVNLFILRHAASRRWGPLHAVEHCRRPLLQVACGLAWCEIIFQQPVDLSSIGKVQ